MPEVRVGIVGLGTLGSRHGRNLATRIPQAELCAICSVQQEELTRFGDEFHISQRYTDFTQMIESAALDAVIIASSSQAHYTQTLRALEAGLHVFVEKPIAMNLTEAQSIAEAVAASSGIFMVGFMRRYDTSYRWAWEQIRKGMIGEPFFLRGYSHDSLKTGRRILSFSRGSGGLYVDVAIHDIDLMRWYLNDEPVSVCTGGGCYVIKELEKFQDADNVAAFFNFSRGGMGFSYVGRTAPHGYHAETEIVGTQGILRIGTIPEKNRVTIFNDSGAVRECDVGFLDRFNQAYCAELQEFVLAIQEDRKPVQAATVEDAVQNLQIALACAESLRTHTLVTI